MTLCADNKPVHPHAESVPVLPSLANTTQLTPASGLNNEAHTMDNPA